MQEETPAIIDSPVFILLKNQKIRDQKLFNKKKYLQGMEQMTN